MSAALADATITRRIAELGDAPLALSPAEFTKLVAAEYDKWAGVIRIAGVRAE
jgi:tripartite-type tricarboxylate transporter receptor subunit TctC